MPTDRVHARFSQLMLPHLDAAYSLARWLMRRPEEAEDAVQEAYLRALEHFSRFQGTSEKAWLLTIVRNVCLTRLKRGQHSAKVVNIEDVLAQAERPSAESPPAMTTDPEAAVIASADRTLVHRALGRLPTTYREILVLREFEELSYQEIADVAGVPIGTVMSRLARARAMLRSHLVEQRHGARTHDL